MFRLRLTAAVVVVVFMLTSISGQAAEMGPCQGQECDDTAPGWGQWSDWGPFGGVTGLRSTSRKRVCQSGGSCTGPSVQYTMCTAHPAKSSHLPLSRDDSDLVIPGVTKSRGSVLEEMLADDPIMIGGVVTGMVAVLFSFALMTRVNKVLVQRKKRCDRKAARKLRL